MSSRPALGPKFCSVSRHVYLRGRPTCPQSFINHPLATTTTMPDSRSRSPRPERRRRSRSPGFDRSRRPRNQGGFRWKDKRPRDDRNRDDDRRLERGYREQYRPRSPRRDRSRDRYGDRERGRDTNTPARHDEKKDENLDGNKPKPVPKKAPVAAAPAEEMIIVNVNDRLGTKAAIPCLASDPISESPSINLTGLFEHS